MFSHNFECVQTFEVLHVKGGEILSLAFLQLSNPLEHCVPVCHRIKTIKKIKMTYFWSDVTSILVKSHNKCEF